MNAVHLIGRVATPPKLEASANGSGYKCRFHLSVPRRKAAGRPREYDRVPLYCFNSTAEFADSYLSQGRLIAIVGRLQSVATEEGTRLACVVEHIDPLDRALAFDDFDGPDEESIENLVIPPVIP
ncbi:single-stranded DNA-binding protein [bacterium]|nr:MAG: single-stranded DNA-binding protein [bacterium]